MLKKKLVSFYLTPWTTKLIRTTYFRYEPYGEKHMYKKPKEDKGEKLTFCPAHSLI